jgi:hypothetical protein
MSSPAVSANASSSQRRPIREGLLSDPLSALESVRLMGSRCGSCAETTLGTNSTCPNCGQTNVQPLPLSSRGHLWTYTVVRHRPPGDYKGPDPFVPFALGLVELPEGLRVLAPVECDIAQLRIGLPLQFRAFVRSADAGAEIVSFAFVPVR